MTNLRLLLLFLFSGLVLTSQEPAPTTPAQPPTTAAPAKSQTTEQSQHGADWWMVALTAGLVIVGGLQALVLKRQTAIIKSGLAETKKATELTRQSLVLTQRPLVIVRNVAIRSDPELLNQRHAGQQGEPISGSIFLANTGTTPAKVISVGCEIFRSVFLPMIPRFATSDGQQVDITLPPGKGTTWPFETTPPEVSDQKEWRALEEHAISVYVSGRISYLDELGTIRSTAFCRQWDVGVQRFRQLNPPDPDYEHAD